MGAPEISVQGGGDREPEWERSEVVIPPFPPRIALHNFPVNQLRGWAIQTCEETHACSWEPTSTGAHHSLRDPPHKAGTSLLHSICLHCFRPLYMTYIIVPLRDPEGTQTGSVDKFTHGSLVLPGELIVEGDGLSPEQVGWILRHLVLPRGWKGKDCCHSGHRT